MNRTLLATTALTALVALASTESGYQDFGAPEPVTIDGYDGDVMEPFVTRDGRHLLFNDSNDPRVDTNLHWAQRIDDLHFRYLGEIPFVNSRALDGVPTATTDGTLFFVSPRAYGTTFSTVHSTRLHDAGTAGVSLVTGVSPLVPGIVNFDIEVSADGERLITAEGRFEAGKPLPQSADLVQVHRQHGAFVRDPESLAVFANINTPALEYAAALSPDEREMFFTRADPGAGVAPRLFRAVRSTRTDSFSEPLLVVAAKGFVEAPTFDSDGRALYFHRRDDDRFRLYRIAR